MKVTLDSLVHPSLLATLRVAAAEHELVLVCQHHAVADGLTTRLRKALPRHEIVAISVTSMSPDERELIEQVLVAGSIPLIVIESDRMAVRLTSWLDAEITVALDSEARAA
ncbi:MAG TPA: hypothetical protein VGP31_20385 [Planosporangium sp.]|nr:hypothetical protein [Planosporangium sp.]